MEAGFGSFGCCFCEMSFYLLLFGRIVLILLLNFHDIVENEMCRIIFIFCIFRNIRYWRFLCIENKKKIRFEYKLD